jgi:hypothetical protein
MISRATDLGLFSDIWAGREMRVSEGIWDARHREACTKCRETPKFPHS